MQKNTTLLTLVIAVAVVGFTPVSAATQGHNHAAATPEKAVKPYPLETCLVSGEKLGGDMGDPYTFVHEGREIQLCCKSCLKDFQADSAKYVAAFDKAFAKVKPYPLKTCLVSGEELGGMGEPFALVYKGQEIKLCCKGCLKDFRKNPDKLAKALSKSGSTGQQTEKGQSHADHQH